jgi:hypothetical protein
MQAASQLQVQVLRLSQLHLHLRPVSFHGALG